MESTKLATKNQILEHAGYRYSFDREVYFNRKEKKAFSVKFVEDHQEDELERYIREEPPNGDWLFFFNSPPSSAVKRELATVLS